MPGLDAIRGLAAFGVLLWHYKAHFHAAPLHPYFLPGYMGGAYLVDVFFVLSGFLLARLYRRPRDCGPFIFKRVTRLFPLHWTTLLVVLVLQQFYRARAGAYFVYPVNDAKHFWLNVGLLQSSGLQDFMVVSFNGPSWSISVEWLTNLVFALVLLLPGMRAGLSFILAVGGAAGVSMMLGHLMGFGSLGGWLDVAFLRGVFGFFAGVLLAEVVPGDIRPSHVWDVVGIVTGGVVLELLAHPEQLKVAGLEFVLVGVLTPTLVAACCYGRLLGPLSQWRPLLWLGDVSFSVYLWHFPVQLCFALLVAYGWDVEYSATWVLAIFVGLTYLVGDASWRFIEKPAQRLARASAIGRWFSA